jgi:hypothetical protein
MFNNKNNNSLQFDLKPNNEAIVLESFIQVLGMLGTYFLDFLKFSKMIKKWPTNLCTKIL